MAHDAAPDAGLQEVLMEDGDGEMIVRVRATPMQLEEVFTRLEDLEKRWEERLKNQATVVQNLSVEREKLLRRLGSVQDVVDDLHEMIDSELFRLMPEVHQKNYTKIRDALEKALAPE